MFVCVCVCVREKEREREGRSPLNLMKDKVIILFI